MFRRVNYLYTPVKKSLSYNAVRTLYSDAFLGQDEYKKYFLNYRVNDRQKIMEKMAKVLEDDGSNIESLTIKTTDMLTFLVICNGKKDELPMISEIFSRCVSHEFKSEHIGAMLIRYFHQFKEADEALKMFYSKEFGKLFHSRICFTLIMDMLYKDRQYEEVLKLYAICEDCYKHCDFIHSSIVTLAVAACYKLNTKESFLTGMKLYSTQVKVYPEIIKSRCPIYLTLLALQHDEPQIADNLFQIYHEKGSNHNTVSNIKIMILCKLHHFDEAFVAIRKLIEYAIYKRFTRPALYSNTFEILVETSIGFPEVEEKLRLITPIIYQNKGLNYIDTLDDFLSKPIRGSREEHS